MPQKKLSQSLNDFVDVLVNEGLEPIRLNLIRVENDLRNEIDGVVEKAKSGTEPFLEDLTRIENNLKAKINEITKNTKEELEPFKLDLIRVENDLRSDFDEAIAKVRQSITEAKKEEKNSNANLDLAAHRNAILEEVAETIEARRKKTMDDINKIIGEKYEVLKNAIENLATRASDAIAEVSSEQEEQYTAIFEDLNNRILMLEKRLGAYAAQKQTTTPAAPQQTQTQQPKPQNQQDLANAFIIE